MPVVRRYGYFNYRIRKLTNTADHCIAAEICWVYDACDNTINITSYDVDGDEEQLKEPSKYVVFLSAFDALAEVSAIGLMHRKVLGSVARPISSCHGCFGGC